MTAGQQLIEQGRQQGVEQERRQSQQRFKEFVLRLLRQRFGEAVDARVEQRVATASIDQLETWSERMQSGVTLAELFAD